MAENPSWINQPQNTWPPPQTPQGFYLTAPPNAPTNPTTPPTRTEAPPTTEGGGGGIFAPTVVDVIDDCMRSVTVQVVHDSALPSHDVTVDVLVNGTWRGSAILTFPTLPNRQAADQLANVEVPLAICSLKIGDIVQARVTDNGISSSLSSGIRVVSHVPYSVLTEHYDNARTGWFPYETLLTTQNVGNLNQTPLKLQVDSKTYAQPLYMHHQFFPKLGPDSGGLAPVGEKHNVVFLATENDSVYAYDPDTGQLLWQRSQIPAPGFPPRLQSPLLPPGFTSVNSTLIPQGDIPPPIGISSTPVIDCGCSSGKGSGNSGNSNGCCCNCNGNNSNSSGTTNCSCCRTATIYVVTKSQRGIDNPDPNAPKPTFHIFLHALDVTTGENRPNSPVEITGQVNGTGGSVSGGGNDGNGHVLFVPQFQNNRAALLLLNGKIYIGFASHQDSFEYHGWVFAYDAVTLEQKSIFCTTPDGLQGGVWSSGFGLSTDGKAIYCTTGNGDFDAFKGGVNYSDTVLKLSPELKVLSYFTPAAEFTMNDTDNDLASGGVLVVPSLPGANSDLIVAAGKDGMIFLLDTNNLGGYTGPATDPNQTPPLLYGNNPNAIDSPLIRDGVNMQANSDDSPGIWGGPAYFNGPQGPVIFYCGNGTNTNINVPPELAGFALANNKLTRFPKNKNASETFPLGGGTPIVTSNQGIDGSGILWVIKRGDNDNDQVPSLLRLFAYDATDLSKQLLNPGAPGIQFGRWGTPNAQKTGGRAFIEPMVINSKVYVAHLDNNTNNYFVSVFSL